MSKYISFLAVDLTSTQTTGHGTGIKRTENCPSNAVSRARSKKKRNERKKLKEKLLIGWPNLRLTTNARLYGIKSVGR